MLNQNTKEFSERQKLRLKFWTQLLEKAMAKTKLHANNSPTKGDYVGASAGKGLGLNYCIRRGHTLVELYIDRGRGADDENKAVFDKLAAVRDKIESAFGEPLEWLRLETKRACRIKKEIKLGGYLDDETKWPKIQDAMIDTMIRLAKALKPHIAKLKK